jgi:transcription factor AP-4
MEQEKRMRREIANSNERRRMQSINAGFQSLRGLLPHHEGEKLSKAAILQQTAEYIYQLEQEKSKLMNNVSQLKRLVSQSGESPGSSTSSNGGVYSSPQSPAVDIPPPIAKRRKTLDGAVESADEGIGSMSPEHGGGNDEIIELKKENLELCLLLERERRHRVTLEEHIGILQQQAQQQLQTNQFVQEEAEVYSINRPAPTPGRVIQDETPRCYTIRNNLETIVEAIRHLEGDHLFSDDCHDSSSPPTTSPCSASPPGAMEICSSPGSSPSHSQSMVELPLPMRSSVSTSSPSCQPQSSGSGYPSSPPASTIVTSLKNHVLNRIARTSDVEEQPINLEFRPGLSVTKSPPAFSTHQSMVQFQLQQQDRPGVIVVKHS